MNFGRLRLTSPPRSASPDVEQTNRRPQVTVLSLLSTHPLVGSFARRYVRGSCDQFRTCAVLADHSAKSGLAPPRLELVTSGTRPPLRSSRCHGGSPVSRRCVTAPHSVLPIHSRTRPGIDVQHRAGVSWPKEDDLERDGDANICCPFARTQTPRSTCALLILFAHWFASSRARPHERFSRRR